MRFIFAWIVSVLAWISAGFAGYSLNLDFKEPGFFWSYSNLMSLAIVFLGVSYIVLNGVGPKNGRSLFWIFGFLGLLYFWNMILTIFDEARDGIVFGLASFRTLAVSFSVSSILMDRGWGKGAFLGAGVVVTFLCAILGILQVLNAKCYDLGLCSAIIPHLIFIHSPFGIQLYRASGALLDPNVYAALLVLGFAAALITGRQYKGIVRFLFLIVLITQLSGIFLSGSRGGVVAVTGLIFFFFFTEALRKRSLIMGLMSVTICLLVPTLFFLTGARAVVDKSTSERWVILIRSAEYLEKFPSLFGQGFLHFNRVALGQDAVSGLVAHNTALELTQHSGVLGTLLFFYLGFLILIYKRFDEFVLGLTLAGLFLSLQSNLIFSLGLAYCFLVLCWAREGDIKTA